MKANIAELAEIFDSTRPTIGAWTDAGMPYVQKGSKGVPWIYDVKACIDWWAENKFRRKARGPAPGSDPFAEGGEGHESYEEAERREKIAKADKAELELTKSARLVVPIEEVAMVVAEENTRVRSKLLAIPNAVRMKVKSYFGGDREIEERIVGGVEEAIFEALADIREPVSSEEVPVQDVAGGGDEPTA